MAYRPNNSIPGNFTHTSSTAGATETLTITNTDNTNAASNALVQVTTGGASAGDPFQTFTITGATSWSQGIDNSVSDTFVLAASTALGTTNVMSATTGGAVSFVLGNVDVTKSSSGATVSTTVSNTSNTASSNALDQISVAGTSAGDAFTTYTISGTTNWSQGVDNSASDAYVIAASTALGTTNVMSVATTGEINYPLQVAFFAYVNTAILNVTGDGTTYTIIYDTEVFDQNSDFNLGTSTLTAPVTGRYQLQVQASVQGGTNITAATGGITTSNNTFQFRQVLAIGGTVACEGKQSMLCDMDAADTAIAVVTTTDTGGKIDDMTGAGGTVRNFFTGYLAC